MGRTRGAYREEFPVGTAVRVVDRNQLEAFMATWTLHNPLHADQLAFAGVTARVASVGFYHGGDELYLLEHVPGIWHEACLAPASDGQP
jgi:hypothetical protein